MSVAQRNVTEDEADIRLDRWFRRHFPVLTQGAIQKLCRTGQVRVDGRRVEAATRLAPGQVVRIPPLPQAPAAPRPAEPPDARMVKELARLVLYQDDQVIVLNKPAGLPVQGGPGIVKHLDGMLDGLRFGAMDRPRLVHRLDRDTSGVLLLARSPGVAARLAAAFRTREMAKTYWAVVVGLPIPLAGRIDLPLVRIAGGQGARTALAGPSDGDAAHAITAYRTIDHAGKRLAWLELQPETGRTHQLRVHCSAIGTPILGDVAYGNVAAILDTFPTRIHLHARALSLPHPAGGELAVEAEMPPHLQETFRILGFEAPSPAPPRRQR